MRRYHEEAPRTVREHRKHLRSHGWPKGEVSCPCDKQAGRFRKTDAFDCGKTLCRVCHHEKWRRNGGHELTRQEVLAELKQKEGEGEIMGKSIAREIPDRLEGFARQLEKGEEVEATEVRREETPDGPLHTFRRKKLRLGERKEER
jgi:hypothetical protein